MKKICVLMLLFTILVGGVAYAQTQEEFAKQIKKGLKEGTAPNIKNIIETTANWLFGLLILLAGIFILAAAYKFLISAGNPEGVKAAKQIILYAILAITIAALSRGAVYIVQQLIGVEDTTTGSVPALEKPFVGPLPEKIDFVGPLLE